MYILATLLVIVLLIFLVAQNIPTVPRNASIVSFTVALVAVLAMAFLGEIRWQMTPAYVLFVLSSLFLLKRTHSHVAIRSLGIVAGLILLGISVVLSTAFPIVTLPAPDGPYVVGTRSFSLLDESRDDSYFGAPDQPRELYVQVWYPGVADAMQADAPVRTLWQDLYRPPRDGIAFLTGYLGGIETHSYQDIPISKDGPAYPVVVFSHSLGLTAEQNTPLMEHLASHGYVAIGVSHPRMSLRVVSSDGQIIYSDPVRTQEAFAEGAADDISEFEDRIANADSVEARAEIIFELGERATSMNEQVDIRAADLQFVLDVIEARTAAASSDLAALLERVDPARVGLIGMSLGGATVIDVCKIDSRCDVGINLDGGIYGNHLREPLQTPFLSMVSEGNRKFGEPLLVNSTSDFYEVLVEGAGHADFSDMTFLFPFLKWLGASGPIEPMRSVEVVNEVSLRFLDAYLRDGPRPQFDEGAYPELIVRMH